MHYRNIGDVDFNPYGAQMDTLEHKFDAAKDKASGHRTARNRRYLVWGALVLIGPVGGNAVIHNPSELEQIALFAPSQAVLLAALDKGRQRKQAESVAESSATRAIQISEAWQVVPPVWAANQVPLPIEPKT